MTLEENLMNSKYYISDDNKHLLWTNSEIFKKEFGPLKEIEAKEVKKRFGLKKMVEVSERLIIKI